MEIGSFATFNIAILVLALGKFLNAKIRLLREFNIPEPVSSGLLVCVLIAIWHAVTKTEIRFDLTVRDFLLLYFFAGIGLNSDLKTLVAGGRPLITLVVLFALFMILQNGVGVLVASLVGLDTVVGLLGGTVSLVGGHGTTIAWAPTFINEQGIPNAMEIGIACATCGLVLASLAGGPTARFLISRYRLEPKVLEQPDVGTIHGDGPKQEMKYFDLLLTLFWLNMSLALGQSLKYLLGRAGIDLPLFVCCLFAAIIFTNTVPRIFPKLKWPAGGRPLALVSEVSLGVFLAMSLMSLQLWTIFALAGPILAMLAAQTVLAVAFTIFLIFRFMGRDYDAAVISSGFVGIGLGATPTAMANMTAVTQKYGNAHKAFIIVPLVSGFFVDIANAIIIRQYLAIFGAS
jgi:ESS family glutamate:Na+ symporter